MPRYPDFPDELMAPLPEMPVPDYTLSTDVVGKNPLEMNPLYKPKTIPKPNSYTIPSVNQDFSDLTNYSTELMKSPAMSPEEYKPSGLRRLLAGVAGGAAGYQGGGLAGLQTSEHVLDTPYRRAMQRYNERVAPFGTIAKQRMDRYKNDIDYMQHSADAFTKIQKTDRDWEESARKEHELEQESYKVRTGIENAETYQQQTDDAAKSISAGFHPSDPRKFQKIVFNKRDASTQPTNVTVPSPYELLAARARWQKAHDERVAKFFNSTAANAHMAGQEAARFMKGMREEWSQFIEQNDKGKFQIVPPDDDTDPSDPIMDSFRQFMVQYEAKQGEILGATKYQSGGVTKPEDGGKQIGKYRVK